MWNTLCFCILLLHVATRIFFCTFRVINNHTDLVGIFSAFIHDEFILSECVKKHLFMIVIHAERNLCIDNILIFSFHSLEFKRQAKGTLLLLLLLICLLQFLKHWKSSHSVNLLLPSCLQVFLLLFVFSFSFPSIFAPPKWCILYPARMSSFWFTEFNSQKRTENHWSHCMFSLLSCGFAI